MSTWLPKHTVELPEGTRFRFGLQVTSAISSIAQSLPPPPEALFRIEIVIAVCAGPVLNKNPFFIQPSVSTVPDEYRSRPSIAKVKLGYTPTLHVEVPVESIPQLVQTFFTHSENS